MCTAIVRGRSRLAHAPMPPASNRGRLFLAKCVPFLWRECGVGLRSSNATCRFDIAYAGGDQHLSGRTQTLGTRIGCDAGCQKSGPQRAESRPLTRPRQRILARLEHAALAKPTVFNAELNCPQEL